MTFGKNLKTLRKNKKLSLRELEAEIGINHNTLGAYERGSIHPTMENGYKIAKYFEVSVEYLILGQGCTDTFRDNELHLLFKELDALEKQDREKIKSLIKRYIKSKKELLAVEKQINDIK